MADPVTAGIAIVGAGLQAYSMISGANAEAEAAEKNAALGREKAKRIGEALDRDIRIQRFQNEKLVGEQTYAYTHSGADISASPLVAMEEQYRMMEEERMAMADEARWKQMMLIRGADVDMELSTSRRTAGYLGAAGTVLSYYPKFKSTYLDKNTTDGRTVPNGNAQYAPNPLKTSTWSSE